MLAPGSHLIPLPLEHAVVRLRNRLHFAFQPATDPLARKIFCLGPAKTGTSSLHELFLANGLRSEHKAGNWHTDRFDCFSDRGDYRPYRAYDRAFPNAIFILNCRSLKTYLRSLGVHVQSQLHQRDLSPAFFVTHARRRDRHFQGVLTHFANRPNLIVVNIERPGAMEFVAERLGLTTPPQTHHHKTSAALSDENARHLATALAALGVQDHPDEPLLTRGHGAETLPSPENIWL